MFYSRTHKSNLPRITGFTLAKLKAKSLNKIKSIAFMLTVAFEIGHWFPFRETNWDSVLWRCVDRRCPMKN